MSGFQLNPEQKKAVEHTSGPLMILAGAGAGKTRVITERIKALIKKGVAPERILAVTFTNKAAKEMRERVLKIIDSDEDINRPVAARHSGLGSPYVATFHSLGVALLREHATQLGIKRHFSIYDRADSTRAVKLALKRMGLDPKQYEPRAVLGAISRYKSEGNTAGEFHPKVTDTRRHTLGRIWNEYEDILKKEGALDFDDLLLRTYTLLRDNEDVRTKLHQRWSHVHIDEYQDTNRVQFAITQMLTNADANICVVGDIDQCLIGGTNVTLADGSQKRIENIQKGELVLSNFGSGRYAAAAVTRTTKRTYSGDLVHITTQSGETLVSTPDHVHFAGFHLGATPSLSFVYLMYKKGIGWRLDTTQTYTKGQRVSVPGFVQRSNQEHADATWVIATCATPQKARELEYILSLTYRIPTVPFVARKGLSVNGYVHDQQALSRIFSSFDTTESAHTLLADHGLSLEYPHHRPQSKSGNRYNVRITLCGDARGKTPMHRISMSGSSPADKKTLVTNGFSVRPSRKGSRSWRFETATQDWAVLLNHLTRLRSLFPELHAVFAARIAKTPDKNKSSLLFTPASSVREGMVLVTATGTCTVVTSVTTRPAHNRAVYDLDIAGTHNFIANGIVTHNSIYSWRGANLANLLSFEDEFPGTTLIVLEQNYRSTQHILEAANRVIEKNKKRKEKKLFTTNEAGDRIDVYSAYSEDDEARFVVDRATELIRSGVEPRDIAVLYRANFQSRALEQAFMYAGVPYQVLGTRFFDRAEVKDVLSYIRAGLNPDAHGDIARISSTPPRGIGKMTLATMLEGRESELNPALQKKVADFRSVLAAIGKAALTERPSEAIRFAVQKSGLEEKLRNGTEEDRERLENIKELATLASKYDELPPEEGIERLLEDASLATDQDSLEKDHNAVKLMTVHASKGLEFDYVCIVGLEEGLFPHERMGDSGDVDEEEERRLFYVALTRARKKVLLTHAVIRTIYGSQSIQTASQFIDDIDDEHLERLDGGYSAPAEDSVDLIDF